MQRTFTALKIISFLVIIQTLVVMIVGSYVAAAGAGLGCPDWPLCYGQFIPSFAEEFTLIEFAHRLLAGSLGILVVLLAVFSWQTYYRYKSVSDETVIYFLKKIGILLIVALMLLGVQVLLGGLAVLTRLPPELVAIHLGTATVFFGMMIFITREIWHVSDYHVPSFKATSRDS